MHTHFAEIPLESLLARWLAYGITTIRNLDHNGSRENAETILRWRARIAAGELLGPRIYTSGPWRGYGQIAAYHAAGYDFVKPYDEPREVFDSLVAAARRVGLPVAGHVPSTVPLPVALAHMKSIEHLTGVVMRGNLEDVYSVPLGGLAHEAGAAEIGAMAAALRRSGVWMTPGPLYGYVASVKQGGRTLSDTIARQMFRVVKVLQDSGVGLLLSADAPFLSGRTPGLAVHEELETFTKVGLTPYQALVTGTRNPAAYFGTLDSSGTVAIGRRADLVLLAGNPLQNIRHTQEPAGVMLGGRWLDRAALDRILLTPISAASGPFSLLFMSAFSHLRGSGLTAAQQTTLKMHIDQAKGLVDSLARASSAAPAGAGAGDGQSQRLREQVAAQLGALRALLPPERQDVFDPAARVWLREQARQGARVAIAGVTP
jgi:hypothetical protein